MTKFYYQIRGRRPAKNEYGEDEWAWPPVFSGMVEAEDRKGARASVEQEYERKFPMAVMRKDMAKHDYLLHIQQIGEHDTYLLGRFEDRACKECGTVFKLIDKYNDPYTETNSPDYCTEACKKAAVGRDLSEFRLASEGLSPPVIYQVRQKSTGRVYVGQTTQAFTLRWWQHLSKPSECKFHTALKATDITDWDFSVLEVIVYPDECKDRAAYITQREAYWVDTLSAVDTGFNTVRPSAATAHAAQAVLL
ncbi:GIY-YIG catalytic domain-containing protein [Pseudomonas asplenii]|uniref:GIY-YIG catalytic domain-containing protein n=2 Tax=Pseudomonas asplenii TaxID=53407 RepID=A0A1H6NW54_9PSED|nr:GIY-YIG nuclease family protein [Pseudomonas fuscovaginae]SEI17022.1 GIY-YIG catalytic domain-containing protein [Pseudomonas fuscovaginae]